MPGVVIGGAGGPCLPDVDRAIDLACRLLAGNLDTPATTEVACLSYGTPLRDAEPVLRQMLIEHDIAVSGPETGDADHLRAALRAFGSSAIDIGKFSAGSATGWSAARPGSSL